MVGFVNPLQSVQQGQDWINGLFQQQAQRQAGRSLATGDYRSAANALFGAGDLNAGAAVQDRQAAMEARARTRETEDRARNLLVYRNALDVVEQGLANGPEGAVAAFEQSVPGLRVAGADDEVLKQLRDGLLADPKQALAVMRAAVGREELELRDGGAGDVVGVNKRTGATRLLYDAPDRPISTPYGIILPPSATSRGAAGGGAPAMAGTTAPVTGAAIGNGPLYGGEGSVSPPAESGSILEVMRPITAQAESGNRDRDNNGNLITSSAGAQGRMQVMPGTNTDPGFGVMPARDNSDAERTRVGNDYLAAMLDRYGGDPAKAWAAYNWGPGNLDDAIARYGEDYLQNAPAETRNYVASNMRALGGSGISAAPTEAMGDQEGGVAQDLGGGWSLQPMETPAERRAQRSEALAQRRFDREEQRYQTTRQESRTRDLTREEKIARGLPPDAAYQINGQGEIKAVPGSNERFTEGQRASAAFSFRVENAARSLNALERQGTLRPSPAVLAFGEGRVRENALSSADRRFIQASREWLAPILRKDTGAAVTPQELVTYMGIYLPNPTDDAATLAQKAEARRVAEQALRAQAGGAYAEMFPQASQQSGGRRARPTWLTPQQLEFYRNNPPPAGAERGTRAYPLAINRSTPETERTGLANIRPGQWFVPPNSSSPVQMPNPNPFRTRENRRPR